MSPYNYAAGNPVSFFDPDGGVVKDPNGNIVFTTTNAYYKYEISRTDEKTKITTSVYFWANKGKILTNKGMEIEAYRAIAPEVYISKYDAEGKLISNNVFSTPVENSYNCTGNALTGQHFTIPSQQITKQYLEDEGFVSLGQNETAEPGDVGLYTDNSTGIVNHLELFLTNDKVSTKGGCAIDEGPADPGKNKYFMNSSTYGIIRKLQPDKKVNIPEGATSQVSGGINEVDNETFNSIEQSVKP